MNRMTQPAPCSHDGCTQLSYDWCSDCGAVYCQAHATEHVPYCRRPAQASIHRDYPIPMQSSKAQCHVYGCLNTASVLVVIRTPHRWLFERPTWGKPSETHNEAPGSMTVSFCQECVQRMRG